MGRVKEVKTKDREEAVGGGVEVTPIGIIEITPEGTRYISFEDKKRLIRACFGLTLIAIFVVARWRSRSKRNL